MAKAKPKPKIKLVGRREEPTWCCAACGAPKVSARPGTECPAKCGSLVTTTCGPSA